MAVLADNMKPVDKSRDGAGDRQCLLNLNMKLSVVEVRRRVLWIDSDAYPLQNIARVQARELALVRSRLSHHG